MAILMDYEIREYIIVHVSKAELLMCNDCWELYCLEYSVQQDGPIDSGNRKYVPGIHFSSLVDQN